MGRDAAAAAAVACVAFVVTVRVELVQQLLLATRAWLEARAGTLVVVALVVLLGIHQVASHVFHPAPIAMFGGKPKVVLTQDHVLTEFTPVRDVFVRNLARGRSLAVQCVVLQRDQLMVDLCGALAPVTVKPPPLPSREGADDGDSDQGTVQSQYEWATDPDAYHPHAVQPVWGSSCSLAALAIAIAVDRSWLDYDKRVKEYWPEFASPSTVSQLLREADTAETGPVALAVLLEKVDPHKRSLGAFIQEELGNKLQLGGGLRHASPVQRSAAGGLPNTEGRTKDINSSPTGGKSRKQKDAKSAAPKSEAEWQAAAKAAARSWYPLVDSALTAVPTYKLDLCATAAAVWRWDTSLPSTPRPARGGWLANGRSLALVASLLARGGRSKDGVLVIRKETLRRAGTMCTGSIRAEPSTVSEARRQQIMGSLGTKTVGGWVAAPIDTGVHGATEQPEDRLLVGSAGFNGGFFAWSESLQLGVGVATAGEFPHCMADDPAHPLRLLANAILTAAETVAAQHVAPGPTETDAEE